MFGYITPVLSVLAEERKQRYRSFYCGVCHALKQRHGQAGRLSLSNDMTFLAMLLSSLYEPDASSASSRCAVHPLKTHPWLSSPMIDYAADMNALLFFYKCEDQRMDEHSLRGKAGESLSVPFSFQSRRIPGAACSVPWATASAASSTGWMPGKTMTKTQGTAVSIPWSVITAGRTMRSSVRRRWKCSSRKAHRALRFSRWNRIWICCETSFTAESGSDIS